MDSTIRSLGGKPDLVIIMDDLAMVVDWKSGWGDVEDPETNGQMLSYCGLTVEFHPEVKRIRSIIVLPKQNVIKSYDFTREDIDKKMEAIDLIIKESVSEETAYTSGSWCQGCFNAMRCPAFAGEVNAMSQLVFNKDTTDFTKGLTEDMIRRFLPFAKALTPICKKIEDVAKLMVVKNGDLDLGGGMSYAKTEETQTKIDVVNGYGVLSAIFEEKELRGIMTISKVSLGRLCESTEKGLLGRVYEMLEKAEAMVIKPITKFKILKGANNARSTNGISKCS